MWVWARLLSALGLERNEAGWAVRSRSGALPPAVAASHTSHQGDPPLLPSLGVSGYEGWRSPIPHSHLHGVSRRGVSVNAELQGP